MGNKKNGEPVGFLIVIVAFLVTYLLGYQRLNAYANAPAIKMLTDSRQIDVKKTSHIDYKLKLALNHYYVFVPPFPDAHKQYGLVVYISPEKSITDIPAGWKEVLAERNLIFIAPEDAGNDCSGEVRLGRAVVGAQAIVHQYPVDPRRIYAAGLSGGARAAGALGFYQSDFFKGTIQCCGCDFYREVSSQYAKSELDSNGNAYGFLPVKGDDVESAKQNVRFVLITGPNDFREGNVRDIYQGGFKPEGFKCLLLDVPNMGHQNCNADTLKKALDFLEAR